METALDFNTSAWPRPLVNASCEPEDVGAWQHRLLHLVLVITITTLLSVVTFLGNSLVLLSVKVNHRLRTINNYFLLSLAVADLLVGVVSMNVYVLYAACGYWPLGVTLCDLWLVVDHGVSAAAVLNLLIISLDRFFCLTHPLSYPAKRTGQMAILMIAAAWLLSFALWTPAILCWQTAGGERLVPEDECYPRLLASPVVTLGTTLPAFFLPALAMVGLYGHVSAASCRRLSALRHPKEGDVRLSTSSPQHFLSKCRGELIGNPMSETQHQWWSNNFKLRTPRAMSTGSDMSERTGISPGPSGKDGDSTCSQQCRATSSSSTRHRIVVRERRVTWTILTILLTFIITRAPHNAMALVAAFYHVRIPHFLWQAGRWMAYLNSALDPACYALCSATFRTTFCNLLRCRRH
ncbi:muscarinic acetylcholine receptor M4-like [Dunckerocampus dactyliophorus]|uniref:muscarinic acetylcholine receptor M4-like n=1 Tax=Dunckerocampus dactyliophorus TaxID=161453 RepID=UPI00240744C7|nr:muscarinic acetylcholine receptor M4-like [Dunckerocampus dactyliophorus]XP_054632415.1 muscarinic acetylcholine receptor M4-like [Dunckerocampus dactyliophorus]